MKNVRKAVVGICMAMLLGLFAVPQPVQAANMNLTVGTTDNAKNGDTVTVRVIGSNNPGISTFATQLEYDTNYLTYTGATWANAISSNTSNVELISQTTENGKQVLNISAVFAETYSNNETIVTLNFTARQNYTTMPITLRVREITDSSFQGVTVATPVVDATAGQTQTTSQSNSQNSSQNNSQNSSQNNSQTDNDDSEADGVDDSDTGDSGDDNSGKKNSAKKDGTKKDSAKKSSKDKKSVDETPKTGTVDIRLILGGFVVIFLVISGICIKVLGKKRRA